MYTTYRGLSFIPFPPVMPLLSAMLVHPTRRLPSPSPHSHGAPQPPGKINTMAKVDFLRLLRHMFSAGDAKDAHAACVGERREEFGCDEEILAAASTFCFSRVEMMTIDSVAVDGDGIKTCARVPVRLFVVRRSGEGGVTAGNADHPAVNEAFVAGIHALIDLIDDAERGAREGL